MLALIFAQKPGALHPDASSTQKHWRAFAFSAYDRRFQPLFAGGH